MTTQASPRTESTTQKKRLYITIGIVAVLALLIIILTFSSLVNRGERTAQQYDAVIEYQEESAIEITQRLNRFGRNISEDETRDLVKYLQERDGKLAQDFKEISCEALEDKEDQDTCSFYKSMYEVYDEQTINGEPIATADISSEAAYEEYLALQENQEQLIFVVRGTLIYDKTPIASPVWAYTLITKD